MRLKHVDVVSCGAIFGILDAGLGFIFGAIISLIAFLGLASGMDSGFIGSIMGVGAIIFIPLFYGLAGFIVGCIMAWLYNIAAGWTGGIELEFEDSDSKK